MYEVLNTIANVYNSQFSKLYLPQAINIDYENCLLLLPFYRGETFNETWQESNGGIPLGLELSAEIPSILKDLAIVDIFVIQSSGQLKHLPKIQFDHAESLVDFEKLCNGFVDSGIITSNEAATAMNLVADDFSSPLIFNNGDFYPPNFIRLDNGKIVLIDWETWNEHSRAYILDHVENVAAYCFVDMWANFPWQKNFVKELRKYFDIKRKDFQKAILIEAADIEVFWLDDGSPAQTQKSPMSLFKKALTKEYMDWLWR